jgi:hypothetical protein
LPQTPARALMVRAEGATLEKFARESKDVQARRWAELDKMSEVFLRVIDEGIDRTASSHNARYTLAGNESSIGNDSLLAGHVPILVPARLTISRACDLRASPLW